MDNDALTSRPPWLLPAAAIASLAVLIVALVFVGARSAGDPDDAVITVDGSTATSVPTTTAPTTTTTTTTTTVDPPTFSADSPYFGAVTLDFATTQDGLTIFDGLVGPDPQLRCVVVTGPGIDGWKEWCGGPDVPTRFLTRDDTTLWLIEASATIGAIEASIPPPEWTLTANGCTSPVDALVEAAFAGNAVMTGAVCVPGEAFVRNSAVFLQPGPADGGGSVVQQATDGTWTSNGGGTTYPCDNALDDGLDRCPIYGLEVGDELFDALLPIPPIAGGSSTGDVVGLRDVTTEINAITASTSTTAEIGDAVATTYRDGTDEPSPTIQILGQFGFSGLELVIVDIPAFDDSILKTTYAVWITAAVSSDRVTQAYAFETCARGLGGPDICI